MSYMSNEGFETGSRVVYINSDGTTDTTSLGTITAWPAIDPDGNAHPEVCEVRWDDDPNDLDLVDARRLHNVTNGDPA